MTEGHVPATRTLVLNDIVEAYLLVACDIAYLEYQLNHLGLPSIFAGLVFSASALYYYV